MLYESGMRFRWFIFWVFFLNVIFSIFELLNAYIDYESSHIDLALHYLTNAIGGFILSICLACLAYWAASDHDLSEQSRISELRQQERESESEETIVEPDLKVLVEKMRIAGWTSPEKEVHSILERKMREGKSREQAIKEIEQVLG